MRKNLGVNQVFLLLTVWVQRSHIRACHILPRGSSHPPFWWLNSQFLGFSQAGLQALPERPKPQGQQGLWVWKLCPVLTQGTPTGAQHHEAGQEGALASARAGFTCRRVHLLGAFVWRGWAEQGRPSLLGLTSRCGRQTPTDIPSVIKKIITGCAAGSEGEALQTRTHNGELRAVTYRERISCLRRCGKGEEAF